MGEEAGFTGGMVAEEFAYQHLSRHAAMRPGQVGECSGVVSVDPSRGVCTDPRACAWGEGAPRHDEGVSRRGQIIEVQTFDVG